MASSIRLAVIAIGCLIGGPFMLYRSMTASSPPTLEQLTKVSGILRVDSEERSTRRSTYRYPVLLVDGSSTRFKYLDWFPNSESIPQLVHAGQPATIWGDAGVNDFVWQVEQDGKIIVPFADVRSAIVANRQYDWLFGVGGIGLGLGAAFMLYRQLAPPADTPRPKPKGRGTSGKPASKKPQRKRKPTEDEDW